MPSIIPTLLDTNNPAYNIISNQSSSTNSSSYLLESSFYSENYGLHPGNEHEYEGSQPYFEQEINSFSTTISPKTNPMMSMAVLMLIVVASLSLAVGAIYLLIYFKSIKPMTARSRSYVDAGKGDDDGGRSKSAHPFFRRK